MIRYKSRGALFGECWFDESPPPGCDVDLIAFRQRSAPVVGAHSTAFLTIVNDLTVAQDAILAAYGKNCRQKIARAEARDELVFELVSAPQPRLDEFCEFYDAFARQKSLRPVDREWLQGACDAGCLALTAASRRGEALVRHGYVVAGGTAWLQYTASFYRDKDSATRAMTARANRWLHWRSMLGFKAMGMARYDWGGLFEDESTAERAGINRFKKEFGGRPMRAYDCVVPLTLRGRLRLGLHRLAAGCRSMRDMASGIAAPLRQARPTPEVRPEQEN